METERSETEHVRQESGKRLDTSRGQVRSQTGVKGGGQTYLSPDLRLEGDDTDPEGMLSNSHLLQSLTTLNGTVWIISVWFFHFACFLITIRRHTHSCTHPNAGSVGLTGTSSPPSSPNTSHPITPLISPWLPELISFLSFVSSKLIATLERNHPSSLARKTSDKKTEGNQRSLMQQLECANLIEAWIMKENVARVFLCAFWFVLWVTSTRWWDCVLIIMKAVACCFHYSADEARWSRLCLVFYVIARPLWILLLVLLWWKQEEMKTKPSTWERAKQLRGGSLCWHLQQKSSSRAESLSGSDSDSISLQSQLLLHVFTCVTINEVFVEIKVIAADPLDPLIDLILHSAWSLPMCSSQPSLQPPQPATQVQHADDALRAAHLYLLSASHPPPLIKYPRMLEDLLIITADLTEIRPTQGAVDRVCVCVCVCERCVNFRQYIVLMSGYVLVLHHHISLLLQQQRLLSLFIDQFYIVFIFFNLPCCLWNISREYPNARQRTRM